MGESDSMGVRGQGEEVSDLFRHRVTDRGLGGCGVLFDCYR